MFKKPLSCLVLVLSITSTFAATLYPLHVPWGQMGGQVVMGRDHAFALWTDYRRTEDLNRELYATRLTHSGEPLDATGLPVTGTHAGASALAALDNLFLVVWEEDGRLYARRMYGPGEFIDEEAIVLPARVPTYGTFMPTAAADGQNFWVAWGEDFDIYAARISPAGQVLDARGIPVCTRAGQQDSPQFSKRGNFLVWRDVSGSGALQGARLTRTGQCLDPDGFQILGIAREAGLPRVAGNAQGWLVVIGDRTQIRAAHVTRQGTVAQKFRIAESEDEYPLIENCSSDYVVCWRSGTETVAARVRSSGEVSKTVVLLTNAYLRGLANSGSGYVIGGWTEPLGTSWLYRDVWLGSFEQTLLPSLPPKITNIQRVAAGYRITWTATAGKVYRVEATARAGSDTWTALADVVATSHVMSWTDRRPNRARAAFYRVRELAE